MGKKKRRRKKQPTAFWAYPSEPAEGAETMRNAAEKVSRNLAMRVRTWENCKVGGKIVISEICSQIRAAPMFLADVTGINPNVMFELGFAIGARKRIWLLLDPSIAGAKMRFEEFRLLTTIGYKPYSNSDQIVAELANERPWEDLSAGVLIRQRKISRLPISRMLYLKSRHETEAGLVLSGILEHCGLPLMIDDPQESPVQTFSWYASQVEESFAVAVHFSSLDREGADLYNGRHAFVAGMAFAHGHPLLLVAPESYRSPIDYRELMLRYREAAGIEELVRPWLDNSSNIYRTEVETLQTDVTRAIDYSLSSIRIGDPMAENEEVPLVEEYFVLTAAYKEVLRPSVTMFVGRKGSGKTANLLKAAAELGADRRNLVCIVKPPSYELASITQVLGNLKERDSRGFALESFWKYLIYTEIAIELVKRIRFRLSKQVMKEEEALVEFARVEADDLEKPFAVRLERSSRRLLEALTIKEIDESDVEGFRGRVSEALHKGPLRDLREAIASAFTTGGQIAVLIDNLDKTWDRKGDVTPAATVILGLLSAVHRVSSEFRSLDVPKDPINVGVSIFVRSDIMVHLKSEAREPDKISLSRLEWDDEDALIRVIDERFSAASGRSITAPEAWTKLFIGEVNGIPPRAYFVRRCLPRPRDLVYFVKAALAKAVDRSHKQVTATDITDAEKDYSYFALQTALVEGQTRIPELDDVLLAFAGCSTVIDQNEVEYCLAEAGVPESRYEIVIEELLFLNFLGIHLGNDDFRFLEDADQLRKLLVLEKKARKKSGRGASYRIHPAFHAYLEIRT